MNYFLALYALSLAHFGSSQVCLSALRGWKGTLYYPQMKDTQPNKPFLTRGENMKSNCVFYLNARAAQEVKLTVGMIKIGEATVKIMTLTKGSKKWNVLQTLSGNIGTWIDLTAVNVANLKIVVPKLAGSFFIDYEMTSCPALPESMETLACTKGNYVGSQCVTQCADEYYSRNINEKKFHAKCWNKKVNGKMQPVWIFTAPASQTICVSKTKVRETCFKEKVDPKCPYKFNDLLLLMGERYEIPKREEEKTIQQSAGSRSLLSGPPKIQKISQSYLSNLLTLVCKKNFCKVNDNKTSYTPACGNLQKPKPRRVCLICRHSPSKPCQTTVVFGG